MLFDYFYQKLLKSKGKSTLLNYGRSIIKDWVLIYNQSKNQPLKIFDIGCSRGDDLLNIKNEFFKIGLDTDLHGLEINSVYAEEAVKRGISVASLDIEKDKLPYENNFFDIIVANQILEHVKEFFWINSEINRVLKPGGLYIIGVPNLASFHNRLLLLFGQQPTSIRTLGPHVRGYTKKDLVEAMTKYGGFRLLSSAGGNFYPFPPTLAKFLSKLFPSAAVSLFLVFEKTKESSFKEFLAVPLETNFKI